MPLIEDTLFGTILRVFPRRTNATPDDNLVWIGEQCLFLPDVSEVHVSVSFSWDVAEARHIAKAWEEYGYTVKLGGPALGDAGGDFVPGRYLKPGYVITSRGCPNRCWFCDVWRREGDIRELPITEGWNVIDSNLLACSEQHVQAVLNMLQEQLRRAEFTGGFYPGLMTVDVMTAVRAINPAQIFTAYDTPDDRDLIPPALEACWLAGFKPHDRKIRCFVLIGFPQDTIKAAEERLEWILSLGATPMAMLYRDHDGKLPNVEWRKFQRSWARPAAIYATERKPTIISKETKYLERIK